MRKLTELQLKFVENYISNGMNATKAYKDAGFAPEHADINSSKLLKTEHVAAAIRQAQGVVSKEAIYTAVEAIKQTEDMIQEARYLKQYMAVSSMLKLKAEVAGLTNKKDPGALANLVINLSDIYTEFKKEPKCIEITKEPDQSSPDSTTQTPSLEESVDQSEAGNPPPVLSKSLEELSNKKKDQTESEDPDGQS